MTDHSDNTPTSADADASGAHRVEKPSVQLSSRDVLQGQKAVSIAHNGALYRLQTTRQGKLILTK